MISDNDYNTSDWSRNYEKIFGKDGKIKSPTMKKSKKEAKRLKMVEKTICPHCATKNMIEKNKWQKECKKCGWDR